MALRNLSLELLVILHRHRNGAYSKHGIEARHAFALQGVEAVTLGLLVKMLQRVFDNFTNTLRRTHRLFNVNGRNVLVLDVLFFLDRVYVVDAERKNVAVIDSVHDCVGVELIAKGLRRGQHRQMLALACVCGKDRCACKTEQMIFLERLYDFCVHISELAAVALVEDDNAMLVEYLVSLVLAHEIIQLLNGCDDDLVFVETAFFVSVLKLSLQNSC